MLAPIPAVKLLFILHGLIPLFLKLSFQSEFFLLVSDELSVALWLLCPSQRVLSPINIAKILFFVEYPIFFSFVDNLNSVVIIIDLSLNLS